MPLINHNDDLSGDTQSKRLERDDIVHSLCEVFKSLVNIAVLNTIVSALQITGFKHDPYIYLARLIQFWTNM